jgi:hypothetical protein
MALSPSRVELVSELAELHRLQLESIEEAIYVGWTHEQLAGSRNAPTVCQSCSVNWTPLTGPRDGHIRSRLETSLSS